MAWHEIFDHSRSNVIPLPHHYALFPFSAYSLPLPFHKSKQNDVNHARYNCDGPGSCRDSR